jgi:hypothetical protein
MKQLLLLAVIVFLSRVPFVFTGYGAEEDAWGLAVTAQQIDVNDRYEVSRLPGHPLQELIFSFIYKAGYVWMNLLTVLISTAGIIAFYQLIRKFNPANAFYAALALAFIPVIYINSQNVMDYTWAMSGMIAALYFVASGRYVAAGILLGCAIGVRITSGAALLPLIIFIIYSRKEYIKPLIKVSAATLFTALLCYLPVIDVYGFSFFTFYEHFPIPGIAKNIYKGTIGALGTAGFLAFAIALILSFRPVLEILRSRSFHFPLIAAALTGVILYLVAFIRLPLKSAFMIPVLAFLIIIPAIVLKRNQVMIIAAFMLVSAFFAGINLYDPHRGALPSSFSYNATVSGQQISFDLLKGPVIADKEKQENLVAFSHRVLSHAEVLREPALVISGWYLNFLKVESRKYAVPNAVFVYYIDDDSIRHYKNSGYDAFYLPLQDQFNDLRFNMQQTATLAQPFIR